MDPRVAFGAAWFPQPFSRPRVERGWRDEGESMAYWLEAPGVTTDEVTVSVEGQVVTVQVARADEVPEGYEVVKRERGERRLTRRFRLSDALDPSSVSARLDDGVLKLEVAKRPKPAVRTIVVNAPNPEETRS